MPIKVVLISVCLFFCSQITSAQIKVRGDIKVRKSSKIDIPQIRNMPAKIDPGNSLAKIIVSSSNMPAVYSIPKQLHAKNEIYNKDAIAILTEMKAKNLAMSVEQKEKMSLVGINREFNLLLNEMRILRHQLNIVFDAMR